MSRLTLAQSNEFKQVLEQRQARVREDIRAELLAADEQPYIDLAGRVHDSAEESVADLLADLNIALVGRQVREIRRIEGALIRIRNGNYGVCVDCGGEIGVERLRSQPEAERCVACQTQREHAFAHEATPSL